MSNNRFEGTRRVRAQERKKLVKYYVLKLEVKRTWNCIKVVIIPTTTGSLGTVSKSLNKFMRKLKIKVNFHALQKTCLLGTEEYFERCWIPEKLQEILVFT